jgi:tetratricopeptide (TPR) repeat protein
MPAVLLLKEVLKKDKNNLDAIWELGKLSMQSKQYEKAISRFEKFSNIAEGSDKVSGLVYLSDAYFLSGEITKSLETLNKAKNLNKDEKMILDITERITRIQQVINTNQSIEK